VNLQPKKLCSSGGLIVELLIFSGRCGVIEVLLWWNELGGNICRLIQWDVFEMLKWWDKVLCMCTSCLKVADEMFGYWGFIFHIRRCSDDHSWNVQPYSQLWSSQCNKFFEWIAGMEFGSQYLQSTGVVNQDAGHSWIKCLFLMGWHLHTPGPRHPVSAESDIDIPSNLQYAMYPVRVHEERRNRTHITGCGMEQWSGVVESPRRRLRRAVV